MKAKNEWLKDRREYCYKKNIFSEKQVGVDCVLIVRNCCSLKEFLRRIYSNEDENEGDQTTTRWGYSYKFVIKLCYKVCCSVNIFYVVVLWLKNYFQMWLIIKHDYLTWNVAMLSEFSYPECTFASFLGKLRISSFGSLNSIQCVEGSGDKLIYRSKTLEKLYVYVYWKC